jgi:hypothetical protein
MTLVGRAYFRRYLKMALGWPTKHRCAKRRREISPAYSLADGSSEKTPIVALAGVWTIQNPLTWLVTIAFGSNGASQVSPGVENRARPVSRVADLVYSVGSHDLEHARRRRLVGPEPPDDEDSRR